MWIAAAVASKASLIDLAFSVAGSAMSYGGVHSRAGRRRSTWVTARRIGGGR
jgi:hypothetical protein